MNLEQGDNKIRIISEFEAYGLHYDSETKQSTICLGEEECLLCKNGNKPRVQFLGWVIDRNDNQIKLLRIGYTIFEQIGKYQKNDEYKFDKIPDYDITINKTGQDLETRYNVIPSRQNSELTSEEKTMIDEKVKNPQEIIENMKTKVVSRINSESQETQSKQDNKESVEIPVGIKNNNEEDINPEDIPF